jgi:hypothetical protein
MSTDLIVVTKMAARASVGVVQRPGRFHARAESRAIRDPAKIEGASFDTIDDW